MERLATLEGHTGAVWSVGLSGDGRLVASGGAAPGTRTTMVRAGRADSPARRPRRAAAPSRGRARPPTGGKPARAARRPVPLELDQIAEGPADHLLQACRQTGQGGRLAVEAERDRHPAL